MLVSVLSSSCGPGPAEPSPEDVRIRVQVSGGLASADYAYVVDGEAGAVVGERCASLCNFKPGDVLFPLSPAQIINLSRMLVDAGILVSDQHDFGTQCCDQFHFVLEYRNGAVERSVRGSSEALPSAIARAIATLNRLLDESAPLIVALGTRPSDWPGDPMEVTRAAVVAHDIVIEARYGGGCRPHTLDLVAWNGWLESFPVQVGVLLAHDAKGDACKALIHRELRFDLTPLSDAYRGAYGTGPSGQTTIRLRLSRPGGDPASPSLIDYRF